MPPKKVHSKPIIPSWVMSCALILACLLLSGCYEEDTPTGLVFDHEQHLGKGFTCGLCHQFVSDLEPTRPPERVCAFCHQIGDHSKPGFECAKCHTRPDFTTTRMAKPSFADNKFTHEPHIQAEIPCGSCHKDQAKAKQYDDIIFPKMDQCIDCHQQMSVSTECETCHEVLRQDVKPANHDHLWLNNHGHIAVNSFDRDCTTCHRDKAFCEDCHLADPPPSHTLFFKNRGHGFRAEINRMECLPCHQQDFCMQCHGPGSGVKPVSHRGGFGRRKPYSHCAGCHFPEGKINGCSACHSAEVIAIKHRDVTEDRSDPIPAFVMDVGNLNCLNACHPFERKPILHPVGILNNNDCLRCHEFE